MARDRLQNFLFSEQQVYSPREIREQFGFRVPQVPGAMRLYTLDEVEELLKSKNLSFDNCMDERANPVNRSSIDVCDNCTLDHRYFVPATSNIIDAKVLFVGEAPGAEEVAGGEPFIGKSGKFLRGILKDIGFPDDQVAFTNVCKCRPSGNRTPADSEVGYCKKRYLNSEIANFDGFIVALGGVATRALLGKYSITRLRGYGISKNMYGRTIFCTWHPSYVIRSNDHAVEEQFREDLEKVFTSVYMPPSIEYSILDTSSKIRLFLEMIKDRGPVELAFDIETPSRNYHDDSVLSMAFSDGIDTWFIPLEHSQSPFKDSSLEVLDGFDYLFTNSKVKLIMQYAQFDMKFMFKRYGIQVRNLYYDTQFAEYFLHGKYVPTGLKEMAWKYTDFGGYQIDPTTLKDTPIEEVAGYNCLDAFLTKKIKDVQWSNLDDLQRKTITEVVVPSMMCIAEMEETGVCLDLGALEEMTDNYIDEITTLEDRMVNYKEVLELAKNMGKPVNFNSADDIRSLLDMMKIIIRKKTKKTKKVSTDAESLEQVKDKHEFIGDLLTYKKKEKILSTYLKRYSEDMIDSKIHCTYSFTISSTGRLSSSKPNLQNVPYDTRPVFTAFYDYLLEADYSQLELRVLADISKDGNLLQVFRDGRDIHEATRYSIFGDNSMLPLSKQNEQRVQAKSVNFSVIYGVSAKSLSRDLQASVKEAQGWIDAFFTAYPEVKEYQNRVINHVFKFGYIDTPFGRRRYFNTSNIFGPAEHEAVIREAINMPIQSTASDIVLTGIYQVWKEMRRLQFKSRMVAEIHDACLFDVCEDDGMKLIEIINSRMVSFPQFPWLTCPLTVDISIGTHWGKLEKLST